MGVVVHGPPFGPRAPRTPVSEEARLAPFRRRCSPACRLSCADRLGSVAILAALLVIAGCDLGQSTTDVLPGSTGDGGSGMSSSSGGSSGAAPDSDASGDDGGSSDSGSVQDSSVGTPPVDAGMMTDGTASPDVTAPGFDDAAGPPGCPNPLGSVWKVTEMQSQCTSTWTRQGTTASFVDKYDAPCTNMATVTVTLSGTDVAAYWTSSSDNDDCQYLGTMNADCSSVSGLYTCDSGNAASGMWSATIQ